MTAMTNRGADSEVTPAATSPRRAGLLPFLEKYALALLFALLCLFFSTFGPTADTFPTLPNIRNIIGNEAVIAVAALASIVPLTCGQFDLSVGAVIGLASIVTGSAAATYHLPVAVAVLLGILSGAVIGVLNGWLVAYRGVNALIATLGTSTLVAGLVSLYTKDQVLSVGIPESLTNLGSGQFLGVPRTLYALVLVAVLVYYLLRHTPYGRYLASVGASPTSARLVGLNVSRMILSSFVLSGALSGVAGVLLLARAGTANPQVGPGFTLAALSAAFLGATAIRPGTFNVIGTLLGVLFVAVSVNGLVLAGAADWVEPTFNGTALLVAVALSTAIARRRAGRA
jgi:ribose transport system permease protein